MTYPRLDQAHLNKLLRECDSYARFLHESFLGECAETIQVLRIELARVTAERDRWYTDTIHTCHDACPRIACTQRREITALKAALCDATRSNT